MGALLCVHGPLAADMITARLQAMAAAAPYRGTLQLQVEAGFGIAVQTDGDDAVLHAGPGQVLALHGWAYLDGHGLAATAARLAALLQDDAAALPDALGGHYTLLAWDRARRTLRCARDALAGYPLHCCVADGVHYHASDIRQLASGRGRRFEPDLTVLRGLHQHNRLRAPDTPWLGVRQHQPGELWQHDLAGVQPPRLLSRVLLPAMGSTRLDLDEIAGRLDWLAGCIETSLQRCLGRQPAALALSGGMDSTLLYLLGQRLQRRGASTGLLALSCTFPGLPCDERPQIEALLRQCPGPQQWVECPEPAFEHWAAQLVAASDYPPFPANQLLLAVARQAAACGRRVLLVGDGGDELLDWRSRHLALVRGPLNLLRGALRIGRRGGRAELRALARMLLRRWRHRLLLRPGAPVERLSRSVPEPSLAHAYYLAGEQIAASAGVDRRAPLRDPALLRVLLPLLPLLALHGPRQRGTQALLVEQLSGGLRLQRRRKVDFNAISDTRAFASAASEAHFGRCWNPWVAGLVPAFVALQPEPDAD